MVSTAVIAGDAPDRPKIARSPRMPLRARVWSLAVGLCLVCVLVGGMGLVTLSLFNERVAHVLDRVTNKIGLSLALKDQFQQLAALQQRIIDAHDPAAVDVLKAAMAKANADMHEQQSALRALLREEGQQTLSEFATVLDIWQEHNERVLRLVERGNRTEAARLAADSGRELAAQGVTILGRIVAQAMQQVDLRRQETGRALTHGLLLVGAFVAATTVVAFAVAQYIARGINGEVAKREAAEADLQHRNEIVAARTRELAHANAELEQFAYIASHDLRAPLRGIDNLAEWITEDVGDALPEEPRQNLQRLRGRVKRMEALLDDILAFSRAGRMRIEIEEVDTRKMVADVVDLLAPPEDMRIEIAGDLPRLATARGPLEQMFGNLIGNAIKHHDRPEGRISVSAADMGLFYRFTVADDGPGIPPEFHARVFQMFQSLKPRDEKEGSGIGLAIVKKIADAQGGAIVLESPVEGGRGARFRFDWRKQWLRADRQLERAA